MNVDILIMNTLTVFFNKNVSFFIANGEAL